MLPINSLCIRIQNEKLQNCCLKC